MIVKKIVSLNLSWNSFFYRCYILQH